MSRIRISIEKGYHALVLCPSLRLLLLVILDWRSRFDDYIGHLGQNCFRQKYDLTTEFMIIIFSDPIRKHLQYFIIMFRKLSHYQIFDNYKWYLKILKSHQQFSQNFNIRMVSIEIFGESYLGRSVFQWLVKSKGDFMWKTGIKWIFLR